MKSDRIDTLAVMGAQPRIAGVRIGNVIGVSRDGRAIVDYPGNPYGALAARCTASVSASLIESAREHQLGVLLAFELDDPGRPVVFDIVADSPLPSASKGGPSPASITPEISPARGPNSAQLARIVRVSETNVWIDFEGNEDGPQPARTTIPLRNLKDPVLVMRTPDLFVIVGQLFDGVPMMATAGDDCAVALRGKSIRIEAEDEILIVAGSSQLHLDSRGKAVTTADSVVSRARTVNKIQGGCIKLN